MIENRVKIKYTILTLPDSDLLLYMKHNAKSGKSFYGAIPKHSWAESWVPKAGACAGNTDSAARIVPLKENVAKQHRKGYQLSS